MISMTTQQLTNKFEPTMIDKIILEVDENAQGLSQKHAEDHSTTSSCFAKMPAEVFLYWQRMLVNYFTLLLLI